MKRSTRNYIAVALCVALAVVWVKRSCSADRERDPREPIDSSDAREAQDAPSTDETARNAPTSDDDTGEASDDAAAMRSHPVMLSGANERSAAGGNTDGEGDGVDGDDGDGPARLDAALSAFVEERMARVTPCWNEAKARGATPEGSFGLRVHASMLANDSARASAVLTPNAAATGADEKFLACVDDAFASTALSAPGGSGEAALERLVILGEATDVIDDDWRRAHAIPVGSAAAAAGGDGDGAGGADGVDKVATVTVDPGRSPSIGTADALVTIVEFSDFQCSFCAAGAMTMHKIVMTYGDRVRFVFKNKPLPHHELAAYAAQAAAAAHQQGKFWEMHDLLFANQDQLSREVIESYAQLLDLDMDRFHRALDDQELARSIREEARVADELGVQGIPTFVINGRVIVGSRPFELFQGVVDEELAKVVHGVADP